MDLRISVAFLMAARPSAAIYRVDRSGTGRFSGEATRKVRWIVRTIELISIADVSERGASGRPLGSNDPIDRVAACTKNAARAPALSAVGPQALTCGAHDTLDGIGLDVSKDDLGHGVSRKSDVAYLPGPQRAAKVP